MTSLYGKVIRFYSAFVLVLATVAAFSTQLPSQSNNARLSQALHMSVPNSLDVLTSGLASIFCLPRGVTVASPKSSTTKITKLYDVENDNSCREVRELITELDLVVEQIIPVAEGSNNKLPGNEAPILVATVTSEVEGEEAGAQEEEITIQGADAILSFLNKSFSTPSPPAEEDSIATVLETIKPAGLFLARGMRSGRGSTVSPAVASQPEKPLILYSYEGNQFCRLVREVLTELDIVYELRSAGKESPRRAELASITGGSSQCPYLIDPNTGTSMPESADIVEYLYKTYASYTPPSEILEWTSTNVMSLAKPIFEFLAPLQAGEKDAEIDYQGKLQAAKKQIEEETSSAPVVAYTYELSPFSSETTALLDRLGVDFKEISLGKEWLPGLIAEGGAIKRAALLEMTGQSSLPHIFVNGKPIGGLFSGSPGLVPMLRKGEFSVGESPVESTEDAPAEPEETAAAPEETAADSSSGINLDTTDAFQ